MRAQTSQTTTQTFNYAGQPYNLSACNALPILLGGYSSTCVGGRVRASVQVPLPDNFSGGATLNFIGGDYVVPGGQPLYTCAVLPQNIVGSYYFDCSNIPETITDSATGLQIAFGSAACSMDISLTFVNGAITAWAILGDCPSAGTPDLVISASSSPSPATPVGEPSPWYDEAVGSCNTTAGSCSLGFTTSPGTWSEGPATTPDQTQPDKSLGDCGCNSNAPGSVAGGDPINVGTGNLFEQVADYETAGPNKLNFTRYYNSLASSATLATTLGQHWRSNFDRYLKLVSTSSVIAERADGRQLTFTGNGGTWASDSDVDLKLVNAGDVWTLTDNTDTVETYTAGPSGEALLTTIIARNGYAQNLKYNAGNQLISVMDSYNRALTFTYQNGLLQTVTTPDGLILTYGYSSSGATAGVFDQLASVSYSTTPVTRQAYVYENTALPFALTGIIDEDGNRFASWSYDSSGRGLTSQHAGGADLTTVVYNDSNGSRMVTNALGQQTLYKFTMLQGTPKVTEIERQATPTTSAANRDIAYDSNGYVASQTDWNGNLTTYVNDSHGQPTTINEAVGTAEARTTSISYVSNYHLPSQISTPGLTTDFAYDSSGNLLTKTLTDTTTTTAPYVTKGTSRTWRFTWSNSLLASTKGPRTDVSELTTFTYDGNGALTKITNSIGQATQITAHLPGGLPTTVIDPNGVTATLTYDERQRLLSSTLSTDAGPLTTIFNYDAAGNLVKTTLPDGSALTRTYDAAHRLTDVTDRFNQSIAYALDALGDRTQVNTANPSGVTQRKHSGTFDALGRVLEDIGGVGQTTKYVYDPNGNALKTTDPLGHLTQQAFDALNHSIRVTDAGNGITEVSYDPHDRPLKVVDPNGGSTTYVYNGFGDVIERVSPDTGKTVYRYDLAGNLSQSVDATGATANYTYDALNRVLTTKYPKDSAENVAYSYDQSDHGFGVGRLTSTSDAVGSLSRSYDERGNILAEKRVHGAVTLLTSFTYDRASRISSVGYPSGWSTLYTRDVMGRITAINAKSPTGASQSVVSGVSYQPYGPVSALTYGNGVNEAHAFDLDYRLTKLTGLGKEALQKLTYGYDAANNVLSIADGVTAANSQSLGYDELDRLTSAEGSYGSLYYTYNAIGNRLTQTSGGVTTSYGYAPHSNQITSIKSGTTTQTVGNTAAGNVNSFSPAFGHVTNLTYNQAGRLATTSGAAGQITQYTYDALGQRLVKVGTTTATTLYQYDGNGHLLQESDGEGNPQVDYIYLGDQPVATIQPSNNAVYFLHDDRFGTPQMATSNSQALAWTTTYQPFGQISNLPTLIVQDLRFPGQENDLETGLYHNGFRDYVPASGRYIESDPIGLLGEINTYQYAGGSPLNRADRWGLSDNWAQLQPLTIGGSTPGLNPPLVTGSPISLSPQTVQNVLNWLRNYFPDFGGNTGPLQMFVNESSSVGNAVTQCPGGIAQAQRYYNDPTAPFNPNADVSGISTPNNINSPEFDWLQRILIRLGILSDPYGPPLE